MKWFNKSHIKHFESIYLNDLHGYVLPHARNILDNEINLNYFDYVFTIE